MRLVGVHRCCQLWRIPPFFNVLAIAFLAGEPAVEQIVVRICETIGQSPRWLRPLAQRYVVRFARQTRPRRRDVIQFLRNDPGFQRVWRKHSRELSVEQWLTEAPKMQPVRAAAPWNVPPIESAGDLARWLGVEAGELRWFADLKGFGYKISQSKLNHYHYRTLLKQSGGFRLVEAPKVRLKKIQQQILHHILERIPPHNAVHGFVKGRSIKTFATPHAGQRVVLRMDLNDFFPTFQAARIQPLFRTLLYPEPVADLLGGICTNAVPRHIWANVAIENAAHVQEARALYSRAHLPQGAPTSPVLANLCSYRIDCRLDGLARSVGASYTRYADDLAFSGDEPFERGIERFSTHTAAILMEEGFSVHFRKTRVMHQGVRQSIAGLVLNQHLNVMRMDFDRLKATLTNCVRQGPESQNRGEHAHFRSHLGGKISFVEMINPNKGKRLRRIFEQIRWP